MTNVIFLLITIFVTTLCEESTKITLEEANVCNVRVVLLENTTNTRDRVTLPSTITDVKCYRRENQGHLFISSSLHTVKLKNIVDGEWNCRISTRTHSRANNVLCTFQLEYPDKSTNAETLNAELILSLEPGSGTSRKIPVEMTTRVVIMREMFQLRRSEKPNKPIMKRDSTTPVGTEMLPVTTQSPQDRFVSTDYSHDQLAVPTEANKQLDDAHILPNMSPWVWILIGAVATGLTFICIINAIMLFYCVMDRRKKVKELKHMEMNERLANRPPLRLPSEVQYDYVYRNLCMKQSSQQNS